MKKVIKYSILGLLFLIISTIIINFYMIKSVENNIVNINEIDEEYDAILILGCKVNGDYPSIMLENRLKKGLEVYQKTNFKLLISGDHGQNEYDEVNVMKNYLLNENVDSTYIFQDHAGFSTYDSIYRAKNVFGIKKIIIITQEYHMYRALYLANALGLDAKGVVAEDVPYKTVMLKNEIREILSRDKNFIKAIFKPKSKYVGSQISLEDDGNITNG